MEKKNPPKRDRASQPAMSHQEMADELGVSRAAISDVEKRALRKLKKALEKRGFTMEDFFGKE